MLIISAKSEDQYRIISVEYDLRNSTKTLVEYVSIFVLIVMYGVIIDGV
jgi:hypothetical protein